MKKAIRNKYSAARIPVMLAIIALFALSILYAAVKPGADFLRMDTGSRPSAMAGAFIEKGYKLTSNGTDNHLILIDLRKSHPGNPYETST